MSYRLGIFGFFAHPELTSESSHHASGNYTLMDQAQALRWVQENIAAFGGDPRKVTIAGESAGSFAVSAQMASPQSRDLIAGAIGESGSVLGSRPATSLADAERSGLKFGEQLGASSLKELRALSAMELLEASASPGAPRFSWNVDGYFFPKPPLEIYRNGEQAHVPLLVGWNSEESNYRAIFGRNDPTPENFAKAVRELYGSDADEILRLYPSATVEQTIQSATDLAGDRFIGFSTWRWFDLQRQTGGKAGLPLLSTRIRGPRLSQRREAMPRAGTSRKFRRCLPERFTRQRSNTPWATCRPTRSLPGRKTITGCRRPCRATLRTSSSLEIPTGTDCRTGLPQRAAGTPSP